MSNQIDITGGARVRGLNGVITGTTGVLNSLPINSPNGIPQLDVNGKILVSQLPNSVMEFLGTWNAATNTPTLANGTGNAGDVYLCTVAGTVDFGAGPITFQDGDYVVYSGSTWERSSGAMGTVTSVGASITGNSIGITGSPVTTAGTLAFAFAGTSGQYINGAGNLVTFPSLGGFVPYSGATGNVNLGEWGITSGYYGFDLTPTGTPTSVGTMFWDSFYRTPSVITGTGATTLQLGQEQVTLVHNNTGATLTDGQVVYVTGSTGELPSVALATNTTEAASSVTFGVVTESIPHGEDGFVTTSGMIHGLNTLAFTEGQALWLGATAGTFTNVKPVAPANSVLIGYVIKRAGGNGSIFVKIQNGYELEELHDVLISGVTNNEGLFWDSATSLWKNKSIATALGYTPISLSSLTATSPLIYNNATGNFSIQAANTSQSGYLTATDWNLFTSAYNNMIVSAAVAGTTTKTLTLTQQDGGTITASWTDINTDAVTSVFGRTGAVVAATGDYSTAQVTEIGNLYYTNARARASISLTTTGSSGASTYDNINGIINVPNYTLSGLGGQPQLNGTGFVKASGTTISYDNTAYVPTSRTLTINGTAYDLSADRTWNLGTVTSVATTGPITGGTITGSGTIGITQATTTTNGYLSSTDWNTFNNKQNALTNPVTGTGTTNYLPKFTGTSTIGNSNLINDASGNLGLGVTPSASNTPTIEVGYVGNSLVGRSGIVNLALNAYRTITWKYANTGAVSNFELYDGGFDWYNAASGTAGTDISFALKMRLTNTGNLGIGVTSPSEVLDVNGNIQSRNTFILYNGTQKWQQLFSGVDWLLRYNTGGTWGDRLMVTGGGNVLIGTTTDAGYKLDVNGTGRFRASAATYAGGSLILTSSAGTNPIYLTSNGGYFALSNGGGADNFLISSTGAATFSSSVTALSSTTNGFIAQTTANSVYPYFRWIANNRSYWAAAIDNGTDATFKIGGGNTIGTSPFLSIDSATNTSSFTTNVGIGTTSPSNLLSVVQSTSGNIAYFGQTYAGASSLNALILLQSGTVPQYGSDKTGEAGLVFNHAYGTGGVNGNSNGGYIKSIRESVFATTSDVNTALVFATTLANTNTERMRITSGGVVQIANASGTQGTLVGSERLNVNGGIYAYGDITSGGTITFANNVVNYGGTMTFKGSTSAGDATLTSIGNNLRISSASTYSVVFNTGIIVNNGLSINWNGPTTAQNVTVYNNGTTSPNLAVLGGINMQSTTSSFVIPRMTTAQRDALDASAKIAGAMIYNTSVGHFQGYNGSGWTNFW